MMTVNVTLPLHLVNGVLKEFRENHYETDEQVLEKVLTWSWDNRTFFKKVAETSNEPIGINNF